MTGNEQDAIMTENPAENILDRIRLLRAHGLQDALLINTDELAPMDEEQEAFLRYQGERWDD